jgi:dTDP-4-amino-4,6-dideoxygalactose transaminase
VTRATAAIAPGKMSNVQAAIGVGQLEQVDHLITDCVRRAVGAD